MLYNRKQIGSLTNFY